MTNALTRRRESDAQVVRLLAARQALEQARELSTVKQIADVGAAAEVYARRQKLSADAIRHAHALKIEALAKLGGMLYDVIRHRGGRPKKNGTRSVPFLVPESTLAELDIDKKTSQLAQQLAALDEATISLIASDGQSIAEALRAMKERAREQRRENNREKIATVADPMTLEATFATIVVDPPWDWADEGDDDQLGRARPTYGTMPFEEIRDFPITKLADRDCHCYLWITNRSLPKGFALLEAWGFRYVTCLTWCKPSFGMGNYFRGSTEQVLFAVKGSQPLRRHDVGTWFLMERAGIHSTKPPAFYALVESCSPGPYLDVFGRAVREGWTVWGADVATELSV